MPSNDDTIETGRLPSGHPPPPRRQPFRRGRLRVPGWPVRLVRERPRALTDRAPNRPRGRLSVESVDTGGARGAIAGHGAACRTASGGSSMDWKLELVSVPVSDVDRAIAFYRDKVGFNLDQDHKVTDDLRFVQLTPVGSACSIAIGTGLTDKAPGSVGGLQLVVADADAAQAELLERGVDASD